MGAKLVTQLQHTCLLPQGSVEAAAESRRIEAQTAKLLAKEAAEIKKALGDGGGKQRDVSQFGCCVYGMYFEYHCSSLLSLSLQLELR